MAKFLTFQKENTQQSDLQKEMITKKIPEEYRPLYAKVSEKAPDLKPTTKMLRDVLIDLANDAPFVLVEAIATELAKQMTEELLEEKFKEERARIEQKDSDQKAKEKEQNIRDKRLMVSRNSLESQERDLDRREREVAQREAAQAENEKRSKELEPFIAQMETSEMRDRMRMYMIFRRDNENAIQTPQNNTAFIAASGAVLAGSPIPIGSDFGKVSPEDKNQQITTPKKRERLRQPIDFDA